MKVNDITKFSINRVSGLENIDKSVPTIFISNHTYLMDIFFLNQILDDEIATAVSSRLMFKNEPDRQSLINQYINPMPIEVHAGKTYVEMSLEYLTNLLLEGINFNIFPEGAYLDPSNKIYKGRTGCTRVLFSAKEKGQHVNLVPVAINVLSDINDLDSLDLGTNKVDITILKPIDYEECFNQYLETRDKRFLHGPIEQSMQMISAELQKIYVPEYIHLRARKSILTCTGVEKSFDEMQTEESKIDFENFLNSHTNELIRKLKKRT